MRCEEKRSANSSDHSFQKSENSESLFWVLKENRIVSVVRVIRMAAASTAGVDRTFNLGLSITVPPDHTAAAQVGVAPGHASPQSPTPVPGNPATVTTPQDSSDMRKKKMSRRQRKKSEKALEQQQQQPHPPSSSGPTSHGQPAKRRGFFGRLFGGKEKNTGTAVTASNVRVPVSPSGQSPVSPVVPAAQPLAPATSPSPRLTSKLRPSASADANLSSLANTSPTRAGQQTTAEITPNAATGIADDELFFDEEDEAAPSSAGGPSRGLHAPAAETAANVRSINRSISAGAGVTTNSPALGM